MQDIRDAILRKWYEESTSIESTDSFNTGLRELYILYDKYAFYNQISQRLTLINQLNAYKTILRFKEMTPPDGATVCCGLCYYFEGETKIINLQVPAWIIGRVGNLDSEQLYDTFGTDNMSMLMLLIFEHQLTHLLFCLWEKEGHFPHPHNPLFECVHNSFFNDRSSDLSATNYDIVNIISQPHSYPSPPSKYTRYTYNSNSCYLDSLLTLIFFTKSSVIRDAIFTTDVSNITYTNSNHQFISPCTSDISSNEFTETVQNLQSYLFTDYMSLLSEKSKECRDVRILLSRCYPDIMKQNGKVMKFDIYSAPEIYDFIAYSFPTLLCKDFNQSVSGKVKKSVNDRSIFTFWEFMEPTVNNLKYILWEDMDCDILVFRNGGFPAITNYGSIVSEKIKVPTYKNGKAVLTTETIKKERAFGEYIINDTYEMVGAILLHGARPGKSGGAHYTAYIKTGNKTSNGNFGTWMEYNDIGNVWKMTGYNRSIKGELQQLLGTFPNHILTEKSGVKPEMYFYAKINS